MLTSLAVGCVLLLSPVETRFVQLHTGAQVALPEVRRSPDHTRAVILIHGFRVEWSRRAVRAPRFESWQSPGSTLARSLAGDSDVFAFAYGQTVGVDRVCEGFALLDHVARLRAAGYTEIVLIGHSAGGLVARQFVEDHPDAGVTKVIQVFSPNDGTSWADARVCVRRNHEEFLGSLGIPVREECCRLRAGRRIPDGVEFVCVIGDATGFGDLVISDRTQWPEDLREQGVPAVRLRATHFGMRSRTVAGTLARLVREPQPRWTQDQVDFAARKFLRSPTEMLHDGWDWAVRKLAG